MDEVVIRRATAEDARAITQVHVAGWRWGYRGLLDPGYLEGLSAERREVYWSQDLADPDQDVVVAERDGVIVGFASMAASGDDDATGSTGELRAIYILEDVAGLGVGARLLERPQNALRERGFVRATLWVLDANKQARAFYERHGWRPDGTVRVEEPGITLREVRYAVQLGDRSAP